MNCKHPSFDVSKHDYCPDCGETDTRKVIDERLIATLEDKIERLKKQLDLSETERAEQEEEIEVVCEYRANAYADLAGAQAEIERLKEELRRVRARQIIQQTVEIERLRTWIENVATDEQLDAPVSALGGQTGRQLLGAFNKNIEKVSENA